MVKTLIIAGTHSGVGKTTLVVGLIAALRARGLAVQPFKVGPDYIDPGHHSSAAGRVCRNLDTWMMPPERMQALFEHVAKGADLALIEGVMGLFDGFGYHDELGSTAQVAKLLKAPVLLVIDAAKMARSAAALARGFQQFDPDVSLAGFLINRVGSENHGRGVAEAVTKATGLPVLGWIPRDESLHVPERHLGLVPSEESGQWPEYAQAAGKMAAKYMDLDKILELVRPVGWVERTRADPPVIASAGGSARERSTQLTNAPVIIAVARDEAFHFVYEENLTLLEEAGATLVFFSPLRDTHLPEKTSGVLLSGGFPEVYAGALSANSGMHQALRAAHAGDLPIYAECGGLMFLTGSIVDFAGASFPMVGLLPGHSVMTRRLTLGYRKARATASSWFLEKDESIRGHEFHYSSWEGRPADLPSVYSLTPLTGKGEPRLEGANVGNLWASYVHVHFWGKPELAERFVTACRRVRNAYLR